MQGSIPTPCSQDDRMIDVFIDATDDHLAELAAEVGEPASRQRARSEAIVRQIRDHQLGRVG